MLYADQPTPPFKSPYQQYASPKIASMLESSYSSPARHHVRSKYPDALGLYDYPQPLTHGLPPSPQPSESFYVPFSSGVSPLMGEVIADPWASGAFDHPVSRSPLPWASGHTSPRSSLSSCTREMSVFSHEGSEHGYPAIKVEYSPWPQEVRFGTDEPTDMQGVSSPRPTSLTIAPSRLNHAGMFSYDTSYGASPVPKYETASVYGYGDQDYERAPSEDSTGSYRFKARSTYSTTNVTRERVKNRRHTDPANAAYRCPLCPDKGFARRYNYNQHMLTHDASRRKENICPYVGCGKEFVRKTDLARHDQSVHRREKPFRCGRCPQAFSRKDTLRRHEEDGCRGRHQVPVTDPRMLSHLRHEGYAATRGL